MNFFIFAAHLFNFWYRVMLLSLYVWFQVRSSFSLYVCFYVFVYLYADVYFRFSSLVLYSFLFLLFFASEIRSHIFILFYIFSYFFLISFLYCILSVVLFLPFSSFLFIIVRVTSYTHLCSILPATQLEGVMKTQVSRVQGRDLCLICKHKSRSLRG